MKKKVLFLCTGNSFRSQMAEALLNAIAGNEFEAKSAGINPQVINPLTIKAMEEKGIDISKHYSKSINEFKNDDFDYLITLSNPARITCPPYPKRKERIHWNIKDPAGVFGSEGEKMQAVREVRDELEGRIKEFIRSRQLK